MAGEGKWQPGSEQGREEAPWEGKAVGIPGFSPEAPHQMVKSPFFSEVGWLIIRS